MTKIVIYEATGIILDYLVAVCEGWNYVPVPDTFNSGRVYHMMQKGEEIKPLILLQYSSDWGLAGPIIDREYISIHQFKDEPENSLCVASISMKVDDMRREFGPTPLVSSMRCHAVNKLGEEVEVPDTLFQGN